MLGMLALYRLLTLTVLLVPSYVLGPCERLVCEQARVNQGGWIGMFGQTKIHVWKLVFSAIAVAGFGTSGWSQQLPVPEGIGETPTMRSTAPPVGPRIFQPRTPLKVVAQVNNDRISRIELGNKCLNRHGREVLDTLINRYLIVTACQRHNVTITDKEVAEEIEGISEKFGVPKQQWLELLKDERGISPKQYASDIIWPTLALRRLAGERLKVTDAELRTAYETQYGPAVQVRMIVVKDEKLANEIHAKVMTDSSEFPRMAVRHSVDPNSAPSGGLVPPIRLHVGYEKIEHHAFALKPGQISPVFAIGEKEPQYVLLRCEKLIDPRPVPFERVREALVQGIRERKLKSSADDVFTELKQQSRIIDILANPQLGTQYPGVAAIINEQQISTDELAEECIARYGKDVLQTLINRKLVEQQLAEQKIEITQIDMDDELGRVAKSVGYEENGVPQIQQWLEQVQKEQNVTLEFYLDEVIWPTVALRKLALPKVKVTDEDMEKSYEANFGERVQCRAIVLGNQRRAREVWEKARDNLSQPYFEDLSAEYSSDPGVKALRGEIRPIHKHSGQPLLEKEAFRLRAGEISSVIQINNRYVILYCVGRTKPVTVNFADVKEELYKDVFEKKLRVAMTEEFERIQAVSRIDNFLAGTIHKPEVERNARSPSVQAKTR